MTPYRVGVGELEALLHAAADESDVDVGPLLGLPDKIHVRLPDLAEIVRAGAAHDTPHVELGIDLGRVRFAVSRDGDTSSIVFGLTFP